MNLYDGIAELPLTVEDSSLTRREMDTSSEFTRVTTVISLSGNGHTGRGEDVTYEGDQHDRWLETGLPFDPTGRFTFQEFAGRLAATDLFPGTDPAQDAFRNYRRWGVESAALDLALKQAGLDLAEVLDREYRPVRFVVSTRLGEPPSLDPVETWLDTNPSLEFKLDPTSDWSNELIHGLAETGAVRILDLKGHYEGIEVAGDPDPELYRAILKDFPEAIIEDPAVTPETRPVLEGADSRVSWDYPITGLQTVKSVPLGGEWINIKPSRFGSVEALLDTIEYCLEHGIDLYGGGQFELDVGRQHLHAVASLFYPDAPNDIAPSGYNAADPTPDLPTSPMTPPGNPSGLSW